MTRVLISIAHEFDAAGACVLVTSWQPTPFEIASVQAAIQGQGLHFDPACVQVVEQEPWSDDRLAELFATYGERPLRMSFPLLRTMDEGKAPQ